MAARLKVCPVCRVRKRIGRSKSRCKACRMLARGVTPPPRVGPSGQSALVLARCEGCGYEQTMLLGEIAGHYTSLCGCGEHFLIVGRIG